MSKLPFAIAQQTVHVKPVEDDDSAPTIDLFFEVLDADTTKSRITLIGKDGADDVVLTFNRGGTLVSTEYRAQPDESNGAAANEARNARDIERIQKAKEDVAKWDEERHSYEGDPRNAPREPDDLTKALAAMELPVDTDGKEPTPANPFGGARLSDGPMRPNEGKPEDDPRRGLAAGDTTHSGPPGLNPSPRTW